MRYSTRVKIKKYVIIGIIAALFIALNIWVFIKIAHPRTSLEKQLVKLPVAPGGHVSAYDDGVLCIGNKTLLSWDMEKQQVFSAELPLDDMQAWRGKNYTVAWGEHFIIVYDANGQPLISKPLQKIQILSARCSDTTFSAVTLEEGQHWIRVFDMEAKEIDKMLFPSESVLDFGYYGDDNLQMWALSIDSHGTIPISHMKTYQPGKSLTGKIDVNDQICYKVLPMEKVIYTVGVHHIHTWGYDNKELQEYHVYGWTLQDVAVDGKDKASFLMVPANTGDTQLPISAMWYIGSDGTQYRVSLPAGILRLMLAADGIYAASKDGVYEYDLKGEQKRFYKMPFTIDRIAAVVQGKAFVFQSGEEFYLVPVTK